MFQTPSVLAGLMKSEEPNLPRSISFRMDLIELEPPLLGRLKKGAFDETLSRGPVSEPKPGQNRPVLLSHKTVYHTAIYGSQKEDSSTQTGPGLNHDQVLGVCTGRCAEKVCSPVPSHTMLGEEI